MLRPSVSIILISLALSATVSAQSETVAQGRALMQQRNWAGAARIFTAVTKNQPKNAAAWYFLGNSLHRQKKLKAALAVHLKATEFATTRAPASYNVACVHALQGRSKQAFEFLKQALTAGFANRGQMISDPELASIRIDKRFAALVPPLLEGADAFVEPTRIIHEWRGEGANDEFGWIARRMYDFDDDGVPDFVTTAPGFVNGGPQAGRIDVYSSRSGKLLYRRDGQPGERFGNGAGRAGDVDADGIPDIIVGAPGSSTTKGRAVVLSGRSGKTILTLRAGAVGDSFGLKVSGVGDLDGDGHADLAVGAIRHDSGGRDAGAVFIFSGKSGTQLARIDGEKAGDNFGSALDATMDGEHRLLVVGAMNAGPKQQGRAYVFRFEKTQPQRRFVIEPDATGSSLGQYFVTIMGDVDSDGIPDVYASDWGDSSSTGRVYVHSGKTGKRLLSISGTERGEGFGTSVSDAGDVNADGIADLIVGAWQHRSAARSGGRCTLHSGKDGALLATWTCKQMGDTFGFDATGLGDVDGDGAADFLLTSAWSPITGPKTGRVFIVAGPKFD